MYLNQSTTGQYNVEVCAKPNHYSVSYVVYFILYILSQ